MYGCMHLRIYVRVRVCMHGCVRTCESVLVRLYVRVCPYLRASVHACMHAPVRMTAHLSRSKLPKTNVGAIDRLTKSDRVRVCMYEGVRARVYVLS